VFGKLANWKKNNWPAKGLTQSAKEMNEMRLMVKYGKSKKYQPFHPTLRIERTGFAPSGQWVALHFRPGCFCGHDAVRSSSVEQAIKRYFADLKRMSYTVVE
jgi:hypothetical protein